MNGKCQDLEASHLLLLGLWICSLTYGIDIIGELKAYDIVALFCMVVFRKQLLPNGWRENNVSKWLVRLFLISFLGVFVTFIRTPDLWYIKVVVLRLYRFCAFISLFLIIQNINISEKKLNWFLNVVFYSALIQSLLIILQSFGKLPILWPEHEMYYGIVYSGSLGMNHLNPVLFMTVGISVLLRKLIINRSLVRLSYYSVFLSLMVAAMLIGEARSAILALAVIFISTIRHLKLKAIPVLAMLILCTIVLKNVTSIDIHELTRTLYHKRIEVKMQKDWGEVESIEDIDARRSWIWKRTIQRLYERPDYFLFGTGFQNFFVLRVRASAAHNLYLHVLGELGIVGLFIFCLWLLSLRRSLVNIRESSPEKYFELVYPASACFATLLVLGIFNESLYPSRSTFGFMGFVLAYFSLVTHRKWLASNTRNCSYAIN